MKLPPYLHSSHSCLPDFLTLTKVLLRTDYLGRKMMTLSAIGPSRISDQRRLQGERRGPDDLHEHGAAHVLERPPDRHRRGRRRERGRGQRDPQDVPLAARPHRLRAGRLQGPDCRLQGGVHGDRQR